MRGVVEKRLRERASWATQEERAVTVPVLILDMM